MICLKGALPLIEVLRLVDSNKKLANIAFIHGAMDQVKKHIQKQILSICFSVLVLTWKQKTNEISRP